jgi:hypothetical protein
VLLGPGMPRPRALLLTLTLAATATTAGCHYGAVSTTGAEFRSQEYDDPWERAARMSAAQDLRCPANLQVSPLSDGKFPHSEYMVDGCAQRAVYKCTPASLTQTCQMQLVAKFAK